MIIVATVLTVYGIETAADQFERFLSAHKLQQYLPFTVLKHIELTHGGRNDTFVLQQYLPFTVLKRFLNILLNRSMLRPLQQYLPFTVLKPPYHRCSEDGHH